MPFPSGCRPLCRVHIADPLAGSGRRVRVVRVAGRLLENCTVDASIFFIGQVFKGARWMPWHQEPMKDVGGLR